MIKVINTAQVVCTCTRYSSSETVFVCLDRKSIRRLCIYNESVHVIALQTEFLCVEIGNFILRLCIHNETMHTRARVSLRVDGKSILILCTLKLFRKRVSVCLDRKFMRRVCVLCSWSSRIMARASWRKCASPPMPTHRCVFGFAKADTCMHTKAVTCMHTRHYLTTPIEAGIIWPPQ